MTVDARNHPRRDSRIKNAVAPRRRGSRVGRVFYPPRRVSYPEHRASLRVSLPKMPRTDHSATQLGKETRIPRLVRRVEYPPYPRRHLLCLEKGNDLAGETRLVCSQDRFVKNRNAGHFLAVIQQQKRDLLERQSTHGVARDGAASTTPAPYARLHGTRTPDRGLGRGRPRR